MLFILLFVVAIVINVVSIVIIIVLAIIIIVVVVVVAIVITVVVAIVIIIVVVIGQREGSELTLCLSDLCLDRGVDPSHCPLDLFSGQHVLVHISLRQVQITPILQSGV